MANHVESDLSVQRFGYTGDGDGHRLQFPHAESHQFEGRSGSVTYGAADILFDGLEGRLDTLRWMTEAMSIGKAWLRDDKGRFDLATERIEMPHGIMLTRADRGVELVSPHVSLSEMRLVVKGPFGRSGERPAAPVVTADPEDGPRLRQDKLRFLDSLSGRIYLTVKVVLDLPVLGKRTLDQQMRIPIQEGSLDYRALDDSLDWLEGAFLDIKHDDKKLAVTWKVPIFGSSRELISWTLDEEASTMASFGRVPVRSLADFQFGPGRSSSSSGETRKRGLFQKLSLDAIDVALSLVAPRSFEAGGGLIMFGGDDQPGMVDLKVAGAITDSGPGEVHGSVGSVDTTIKDVRIGPAQITADRLHFDGLDELEVVFDGFRPTRVTVVVHRVTATNLSVRLAGKP